MLQRAGVPSLQMRQHQERETELRVCDVLCHRGGGGGKVRGGIYISFS